MIKDNFNIGGRIIELDCPKVMTIINATPDSFFSESRKNEERALIESVEQAIANGADILDIGGYSTRPGADFVSTEEEIRRISLALKTIKNSLGEIDIPISIDSFRADVIKAALDTWGAVIVNDISSGEDDTEMLEVVGDNRLPYIAMHKKGTPKSMDLLTDYRGDIVKDIVSYFSARLEIFKAYGINDIILDIGFGFAKNLEQNFELVKRYNEFSVLGYPTLAGISRKRMIWQTLDTTIEDSLNGTSIMNFKLLEMGAKILRVHDTKEAQEAIKLYKLLE